MGKDRRSEMLDIIKDYLEQGKKPPTKEDFVAEMDTINRTGSLDRHLKILKQNNKIKVRDDNEVKNRYTLPSHDSEQLKDEHNELWRDIEAAIPRLRSQIRRDPRPEEVAEELGQNPNDDIFQSIFARVAKEMDWHRPNETQRAEAQEELRSVLREAIDRHYGITERTHVPPDQESDDVLEYCDDHGDLLDEVEISRHQDGELVIARLPPKLEKYCGQDQIRYER